MADLVRKLMRTDISDSIIGGVCGGLAKHLGINSTVFRLGTIVVLFLTSGLLIFAYAAAIVLMPSEKYTPSGF